MRRLVASLIALACACSAKQENAPPPPNVATALGGAAARVGEVSIDRALVLAVARARRLDAHAAAGALIDDALLAAAAREAGGASSGDSALARALAAKLRSDAIARGPFTDSEIDEAAKTHPELDRPATRVVVHALVPAKTPGGEAAAVAARSVLAAADSASDSEGAFIQAAKKLRLPNGEPLVVETLPPVAADGRIIEPGVDARLDATFTAAAFALAPNETSNVVATPFGWHVIRLLRALPAHTATREEKLEKLEPELVAARVKLAWDPMLERLRKNAAYLANDRDLARLR